MTSTFYSAASFNKPLVWDTSQVTSMNKMFQGAGAFNQQLKWDTSAVIGYQGGFGYTVTARASPRRAHIRAHPPPLTAARPPRLVTRNLPSLIASAPTRRRAVLGLGHVVRRLGSAEPRL